jgi:hypothetical protein
MQRASLLLLSEDGMDDGGASVVVSCLFAPPSFWLFITEWNHFPFGKGWVVRFDHRPYDSSRHDSVTSSVVVPLCDK